MGKVHRIKKHFWRVIAQEPLPPRGRVKHHYLAHTSDEIFVGRRYDDSVYAGYHSYQHSYDGLLKQLIKAYESGSSSSD